MNNSKVAIVVNQVIEKVELIAGGLWAAFFYTCRNFGYV